MDKKTLAVVFTLFAMLFGACSFSIDVGQGSGNVVTETRDVSNFDEVSLSGIGDIILTQGDIETLEIEAEDNILSNIKTEVRGDVLYISYERKSFIPTKAVKFYLTMCDVHGLEISGVSNIRSDSVKTDELEIGIRGTGNININRLEADRVMVNVSGAGNFNAEGEVQEQRVVLSGAGNYNGEDLKSSQADVTISGLGKVTVWVTENLDVTISGSGNVEYYGSPRISQNISGIGHLNEMGNK